MARRVTLVSVVGARPQFVKLGPIARAIENHGGARHRVVHTGQHYDHNMSASFFDELQLPKPDIDLGVGSGSHAVQTASMLEQLETLFLEDRPDVVLVYGDTNSTLAATLAASKIHVPIAHIEAGLRSFNRTMPEEINRLVADHCADRLYAPTPQSLRNLERENLADRAVLSGDVMLDTVLHNIKLSRQQSTVLADLGVQEGQFGLVTVHRPVNTDGGSLRDLMAALDAVAQENIPLIFPVHPRTRSALNEMDYSPTEGLTLVEPLPYLDSIAMISAAAIVVTDSGGVQKEAAFLHTPCLTMRNETEWTETLELGVNYLVGNRAKELSAGVTRLLAAGNIFTEDVLRVLTEQYGCGKAAESIINDCINWASENASAAA